MHDLTTRSGTAHYYGDIVRLLFLVASGVMLVGLPAFAGYLPNPTIMSVFAIVVLGCAAGLTNPNQPWSSVVNAIISVIGFIVFESYAVAAYNNASSFSFLAANIVLGFIFMAAIYFSLKTVRSAYFKRGL